MDTIEKELETNRVILDAGIQDQEKWEQNDIDDGHMTQTKSMCVSRVMKYQPVRVQI